ncbi:MAG: hypothetical protein ACFCA4_12605 [Cyanophyceae cyanobacterium]
MGKRTAFFGAGEMIIIDPATNKLYPTPPASIELTSEAETAEARGLVGGTSKVLADAIASETHTLTVTFEVTGHDTMELAMGRAKTTTPEITIPRHGELIVPDDGNYAYAGLTASTTVLATVEGVDGYFLTPAAAAPQAGEFQVTTDSLVFNAEEAGKAVGIAVYKTYTNVPTIGRDTEAPTVGSGLESSFTLYANGGAVKQNILIPQMSLQSRPTLSATGEVTTMELVFSVQQLSGYALPYVILDVA